MFVISRPTNYSGNESRSEDDEESQNHDPGRRPILKTATPSHEPYEALLDRPEEEDRPPDRAQKNVDRGHSSLCVDEGECKGEEHPSNHVVPYSRGEDHHADPSIEKLRADQDPTKDWESGDRHSDSDEEQEVTEGSLLVIDEVVIYRDGYCYT